MELGTALHVVAQNPESEALFQETLQMRGSMLDPDDEKVLSCLRSLALLRQMQRKLDEGYKLPHEVVVARSLSLLAVNTRLFCLIVSI